MVGKGERAPCALSLQFLGLGPRPGQPIPSEAVRRLRPASSRSVISSNRNLHPLKRGTRSRSGNQALPQIPGAGSRTPGHTAWPRRAVLEWANRRP